MATVADLITGSLQDLGSIAAGETPSAEDAAFGLSRLNSLLEQWATESLTAFKQVRSTWNIVSGDGSYSVGSGGNVNIARPAANHIEAVCYQDTATSPTQEYPLEGLTDDAWSRIPQKDLTSETPTCWNYGPTYPLGTLDLWPIPTSTTLQGVIYVRTAVASFSLVTDSVSLPPGYERALRTNLALEMAPAFQVQPNPLLVRAAQESLAALKRANWVMTDLSTDEFGAGVRYNILTD
jgi:hypothetical protein